MDNLSIKEVINGKLIEIENLTVRTMLRVGLQCKDVVEHERLGYMICATVKVNGFYLDVQEFLLSTNIELFNFITDSFNAMTNNNLI